MGVGRGLAPHPGPCQYLVGLRGRGACLRCPGPHQVTTGVACVCHSVVQRCLGPSGLPDSPAPTGFALSARAKGPQETLRVGREGGAEGWEGEGQREEMKDVVKCNWCLVGPQCLLNEWMNPWGWFPKTRDGPVARGGVSALQWAGRALHMFVC